MSLNLNNVRIDEVCKLAIDYRYEIVPSISTYQERAKSQPYYRGVIRCIQGNRVTRVKFPCSERFAGNVEWFRKEVKRWKI